MKQLFNTLVMLILLFAVACKDNPVEPTFSADDEVREAIFRYQIQTNGSGVSSPAVIFLGLGPADSNFNYYSDPSNDLMDRFKDNNPPVKKASRCKFRPSGYFDVDSGQRGLLLECFSITVGFEFARASRWRLLLWRFER